MVCARWEVVFWGHVQGVGFRATAVHLAKNFEVVGEVGNEPDGSVRLVAEGESKELRGFLEAIAEAMSGRIRETRVNRMAATGEFSRFTIRRF